MKPMPAYLVGTGSWFMAFGIQSVMFTWLVTMVLRESPNMVGVAQMTLLLPGTLLILIGGSIADRVGGQRSMPTSRNVRC
jgi:nitrate/nitrite transporter NarK